MQNHIPLISDDVITSELVIIGAGGFGTLAASVIRDINAAAIAHDRPAPWAIIGYADGDATKRGTRHEGYIVQGTIEEMERDFQGPYGFSLPLATTNPAQMWRAGPRTSGGDPRP